MKKNKLLTLTTSLLLFAAGSLSAASLNFVGQDVGAPALKGSAVTSAGKITITGGGNDIWGSADNFYFYYAWAQGQQWDAYVKVHSLIGPDPWTKAELMVRVADTVLGPRAGDQFIATMTTPAPNNPNGGATDRIRGQGRTIYGGGADEFGPDVSAQITPNYEYSANAGSTWLRVIRNGAVFTLLSATNSATFAGANWITNGVIDTRDSVLGASSTKFTSAFPDLVAVGIAVTAHNDTDITGGIAVVSELTATFPPVTPPTQIGATAQPANATNYAGSTATFRFTTTNNASPNVVIWPAYVSYQWYKNGTAVPGATATVYSPLLAAADDGAQYHARATIAAPYNTSVQGLTSSTGTVKVLTPTVYVKGLKQEFFAGETREQVELGNTPGGTYSLVATPDDNGGYGNNYVRRFSGYFIPPTTDTYRFFVAGDDDTDLFLSIDSNPANKKIIAQETGWSGFRSWLTAGNAGAEASKRSDMWSDTNFMPAWTEATTLTAGQRYYIEAVLHQGGGGDNFGITYQTKTMMDAPNWGEVFTNGVASLMHATNNNIALMTGPTTSLEWVTQPRDLAVYEGDPATFTVSAKTDSELSPMYQWYRDGTAVAGATKSSYTISPAALTDNNAQVHVIVQTAVENFALTSSVVKLTVSQAVLEKGFAKVEWWPGAVRADVLNGVVGTPAYTFAAPAFESSINNEAGSDYANRISGFVIPATTAAYDFFVNSDDDSDLFLSTNDKPATKRLIARETSWSDARQWTAGNSDAAMKRSDTFTDPANGTQPYAAGINLTANTKYYLEVVHHEGGGGDNLGVTWKLHSDPNDPALGSASTLTGNVIAMFAPRSSYVAFTAQPQNITVDPLGLATFTAPAVTDSVIPVGDLTTPKTNNFIIYQWAKNGVDIPGATAPTLTYGPVLPAESGSVFTTKIRALGYADAAGNPIWSNSASATLTVQTAVFEPGLAKVEYWQGGTRLPVEQGTAGPPTWVTYIQQWDQGNWGDAVNNYAKRYSGYFVPPATDKYAFFINADDDADLFLSTDSNPANKRLIAQETQWGNGSLQWTATSSVQEQRKTDTFSPDGGLTIPNQEGIQMTAGQKYYMEGVLHEGGGGDYLQVLWTNQANIFDVVNGIPVNMTGSVIGTYVPQVGYVAFTQQPANATAESLMSATFSAAGTSDSTISLSPNGRETLNNKPMLYQWYRGGVAIPGATKSTYTIDEVLPADNNAQFMVKIRTLGYGDSSGLWWSNSQTATLTVESKAPTVTAATFYTDPNGAAPVSYVDIGFNKRMDPATLGSLANYTVTGGLTLTDVAVSPDGRAVKLTVTGTPAAGASVTVKAGKDATGTDLVANTVVNVQSLGLTFKDIGLPADPSVPREADPAFPSVLFVEGPNEFVVKAQGSDIWNNADGFNFLYEQKTGNFDVVVRQKSISHSSMWAKGGLMVRESTAPGSRNWNIVNTPLASDGIMAPDNSGFGTSAVEANFRGTTDGATAGWDSNRGFHSAYPNAWLRMKREGNVLTAYYSTDGQNWTQAAAQTVADLPVNMLVGMATTAHNNDPAGTPPENQLYWNTVPYADWNSNYQPAVRPTLSYSISGNQMTISWLPAVGTLQQSSTLADGSWTTVPSTGGSATVQIGTGSAFFRVMP